MPKVTLEIVFNQETGEVGVRGPLHDKLLCYGLLSLAKDAIRSHQQEPQPLVAVPQFDRILRSEGRNSG